MENSELIQRAAAAGENVGVARSAVIVSLNAGGAGTRPGCEELVVGIRVVRLEHPERLGDERGEDRWEKSRLSTRIENWRRSN